MVKNPKADSISNDPNSNNVQSNEEPNHFRETEDVEVQRISKDCLLNETSPIPQTYDEEIAKAPFSSDVLSPVPMIRDVCKAVLS